jgi:RimJ/RimL family protein N-acetyltransferase
VRTAPDFREQRTLTDGTHVVFRHVRPSDAPELLRAFERLSPGSRYRRFFGGLTSLTGDTLRYLTEVDGHDHVAIVALHESNDLKTEQGLGVARFVRLRDDPDAADAAVTVVDDYQRRGLGKILATILAEAARERGVRRFRADVLADNQPMRAIMTEIGATERGTEAGVIRYDIALDLAEPAKDGKGGSIDRFLRGAASSMAVLLRRLGPPASAVSPGEGETGSSEGQKG